MGDSIRSSVRCRSTLPRFRQRARLQAQSGHNRQLASLPVQPAWGPPMLSHRIASEILAAEIRDARSWQIAALGSLLAWNISTLSLGASLIPSLVAILVALLAQAIAALLGLSERFDLRSPLITGCSLALLIRGDAL